MIYRNSGLNLNIFKYLSLLETLEYVLILETITNITAFYTEGLISSEIYEKKVVATFFL